MHFLAFLMQDQPNMDQIRQMAMAMMAIIPFIVLVGLIIVLVPFWFICKKAGFSPWLTFLNIIPMGNLVLIYVLAFADWKVASTPPPGWAPMPPYPPQPPAPPQF